MKKKFYPSRMFFYMGIALILGIPFAIFVPVDPLLTATSDIILMRVFNGLFYGGLLVGSWGGIGIATNLGGFSLVNYSMKKTWQVLFKSNQDLGEKKLGSYHEYLNERKKKPEVFEMMLGGVIPAVVSLIISCFIYL